MDGWQALADEHGIFSAAAAAIGAASRPASSGAWCGPLRRSGSTAAGSRCRLPLGEHDGTPWERRRRLHARPGPRRLCGVRGTGGPQPPHGTRPPRAPVVRRRPASGARDAARRRSVPAAPGADDPRARERWSDGRRSTQPCGVHPRHGSPQRGDGGLVAADAALHRRPRDARGAHCGRRQPAGPGSLAARHVAERADPCAESPGETRLREALRLMRVPATAQVPSTTVRSTRSPTSWSGHRVVIEFDGFVKYGRRVAVRPWSRRPPRWSWPRRSARTTSELLGYVVVRVTWPDLEDLPRLRRRIEAAGRSGSTSV